MPAPSYNALFLCTGNSARSVLAECLLARHGEGRFRAYSAGSHPKDAPHPQTLALLSSRGYDTSLLRSKSWEEFATTDAPELHFLFTVCDVAHGETCPVWPGRPISAHWGVPDPAAVRGSSEEVESAFERAYLQLEERILRLVRLPLDELDPGQVREELDAIGRSPRR